MISDQYIDSINTEKVKQIAMNLGLTFSPLTPEGGITRSNLTPPPGDGGLLLPIDILDYIYAILHSPTHREKYKEFLKIDFPRVPFPGRDVACNVSTFWHLVKLGGELRQIHLLESPVVDKFITQYPVDGNNIVLKPRFLNSPLEGWLKAGVVNSPLEGCPQNGVADSHTPQNGVADSHTPQNGVADSPPLEGWSQTGVVKIPHAQIIFIKKIKLKLNPILELPYNPKLKQRAKELRQAGNLPEVLFWMQVTKGGFHKIDFDRQRIIGNYIVDFYVKKLGLVVEIDGISHVGKEDYDRKREDFLISLGLKVYRIKVGDIMQRMPEVMVALEEYIIENYGFEPPHLSGTPPTEGNLGKVYINDTQYFDNVPEIAWNFYIGGYQPAQKWLKDRKDRKLEFEDILHYQKIIVALTVTDRLMKEIDKIEI